MKKIISIGLIMLLISGLSACNDVDYPETINETTVNSEDIIINDTDNNEILLLEDTTWGASAALSSEILSLEDMLIYAIQDEYSAKAEYEYIISNFDITKPFTNIIQAENTHIDLLLPFFDTYNLTIPEDTATEHLIEIESTYEAFETGVYAEIINIAMYNHFLEGDLPEDIKAVFISLRDASMNHLNAFEKNLEKLQ